MPATIMDSCVHPQLSRNPTSEVHPVSLSIRSAAAICALFLCLPHPANAADWQPTIADLLAKEKPGYGGLSGVIVDHATGTVFIELSDRGLFRSKDQCKTWERVGKEFKGRTEQPGCMSLDPTGKNKRLLCATVYGGPVGVVALEDDSWRFF